MSRYVLMDEKDFKEMVSHLYEGLKALKRGSALAMKAIAERDTSLNDRSMDFQNLKNITKDFLNHKAPISILRRMTK